MQDNKYYGIYQGIVTNSKDEQQRGRIKIKCPSVLSDVESAWCDPVVPVCYDNGGDFCIPLVDETVWVMFVEGDVNRPVYLGNWWQKDMTPLGTNYKDADKVRIISYGDCTITMKMGVIDINVGEGVCDLKIEHNKVTIKGDLIVDGSIKSEKINSWK